MGIMARLGHMEKLTGAFLTAVAAGLTAVVISTPLNVIFWGGATGNVWGDLLFGWSSRPGCLFFWGHFSMNWL